MNAKLKLLLSVMLTPIVAGFLALGCIAPAPAQAEETEVLDLPDDIPILVFSGQSNMSGIGVPGQLPSEYNTTQTKVLYYYGGGSPWAPYNPGAFSNIGPESSTGFEIAKHIKTMPAVGMVKYAIGGTNLALQWNPTPGIDEWSASKGYPSHSYYPELRDMVKKSVSAVPSLFSEQKIKIKGHVAGFFWMQGESDAANKDMASLYKIWLKVLIEAVRKDFGDPNLPVVLGEIAMSCPVPYKFQVIVAQRQIAAEMKNVRIVSTSDLPMAADRIHYSTQGLATLGKRFADAFMTMYKPPVKKDNTGASGVGNIGDATSSIGQGSPVNTSGTSGAGAGNTSSSGAGTSSGAQGAGNTGGLGNQGVSAPTSAADINSIMGDVQKDAATGVTTTEAKSEPGGSFSQGFKSFSPASTGQSAYTKSPSKAQKTAIKGKGSRVVQQKPKGTAIPKLRIQ